MFQNDKFTVADSSKIIPDTEQHLNFKSEGKKKWGSLLQNVVVQFPSQEMSPILHLVPDHVLEPPRAGPYP